MKEFFKKLEKAFYKACDKFSNKMHSKGYRYNDMGAMVFKLGLIVFILFLIILGMIVAMILL